MRDPGETVLDLTAPETVQDPFAYYRWLRDEAPVHLWEVEAHEKGGAWLVSRFEDVRALQNDPRLIKRSERVGFTDVNPPILMFLDPPEHTRLRRPVTATFTKRRVEDLRSEVVEEVVALTQPMVAGERVEVISSLAQPLPLRTITRLLGLDPSKADLLSELGRRIFDGVDMATLDDRERVDRGMAAVAELRAHMSEEVARKLRTPGEGMLSALLETEVEGERLSEQEVTMYGTQLFVNGHETTISLIATLLFRLLEDRSRWERIVAAPELIPTAVEEALRYDAPTQRTSSYTLEPITLHGTTIPAGQQVMSVIGAANHDDRVFHRPEVFDVGRSPNPHLAFGHGRHHCPGAALSRLQAQEVLRHLTSAAPDLELVGDRPRWRPNSADRSLASLTVARRG